MHHCCNSHPESLERIQAEEMLKIFVITIFMFMLLTKINDVVMIINVVMRKAVCGKSRARYIYIHGQGGLTCTTARGGPKSGQCAVAGMKNGRGFTIASDFGK